MTIQLPTYTYIYKYISIVLPAQHSYANMSVSLCLLRVCADCDVHLLCWGCDSISVCLTWMFRRVYSSISSKKKKLHQEPISLSLSLSRFLFYFTLSTCLLSHQIHTHGHTHTHTYTYIHTRYLWSGPCRFCFVFFFYFYIFFVGSKFDNVSLLTIPSQTTLGSFSRPLIHSFSSSFFSFSLSLTRSTPNFSDTDNKSTSLLGYFVLIVNILGLYYTILLLFNILYSILR